MDTLRVSPPLQRDGTRKSGHCNVMGCAGWCVRDSDTSDVAHPVMRTGGTLLALLFVASCDAGMSPMATNAILADVSAPEAEGGLERAAVTGDAHEASADTTLTSISDASADSDSAGDVWSPGPARQDAAPGVGFDATNLNAPGPDPSPVGCGADAAEAGFCPLPYSVCADSRWLVFYDNAQCVSGSCAWEKRYLDCGSIGCFVGQCRPPFTR
jgi:hypothetical protein